MKRYWFLKIFIILFPVSLDAQPTLYGKLWLTLESQDTYKGTETEWQSNTSRVGVKDSFKFYKNTEFIYQVEYEFDPVDGKADKNKDRIFKQRNSFLGIEGPYGTIFIGTHDTAVKRSSSKIDLFNDLTADIKNILYGENRTQDLLGYKSPVFGGGFTVTLNSIKKSEGFIDSLGDTTSVSINYKSDFLYVSLANDSDVKGYDNTRVSLEMPFNKTKLGFIYQDSKDLSSGREEDGYVVSASREISNNSKLKIQLAKSDMKLDSGKQVSIGYDYLLNKNLNLFIFFSDLNENTKFKEKEIGAIGFEYKF